MSQHISHALARTSSALARISASRTTTMTDRAIALRAEGRDIISLSVGEPDFPTPPHVIAAAKAALDAGDTRYTAVTGTAALREAAALHFARDLGITVPVSQVIVSAGGKQAIFLALAATLDPGDEVLIPAPWWVSYPKWCALPGRAGRYPDHAPDRRPHQRRAARSRHHAAHSLAPAQQPRQPHWRDILCRRPRRARRSAAPPSPGAGDERRYLRAAALRDRRARDAGGGLPRSGRARPHCLGRLQKPCDDRLQDRGFGWPGVAGFGHGHAADRMPRAIPPRSARRRPSRLSSGRRISCSIGANVSGCGATWRSPRSMPSPASPRPCLTVRSTAWSMPRR